MLAWCSQAQKKKLTFSLYIGLQVAKKFNDGIWYEGLVVRVQNHTDQNDTNVGALYVVKYTVCQSDQTSNVQY